MILVQDPDLTIHVGDALEVLRGLPDGSVDCCATSPPYWGLRDYGADGQLGLEATPEEYVAALVGVFGEVRRVLSDDATLWLNLGDSYSHGGNGSRDAEKWPKQSRNDHRIEHRNTAGGKPKDLVGIPWRVAFALQADGWYLRSDIIWAKPNPMPESVTDRPTKSHEYLFLLSKSPRYFFDQEAVREPAEWARWGDQTNGKHEGSGSSAGWIGAKPKGDLTQRRTAHYNTAERYGAGNGGNGGFDGLAKKMRDGQHGGRNVRSVWSIATQPYSGAHFATWPEKLAERIIKAGCPEWVCATCGKPRERIVERTADNAGYPNGPGGTKRFEVPHPSGGATVQGVSTLDTVARYRSETVGWSDCGHGDYRPGTVLDPFFGAGTTGLVARRLGRSAVGIELNPEYARLAATRCQQLSLLAG